MNGGGLVFFQHPNFVFLHPRGVGTNGSGLEEIDAVEVFHGIQTGLGVAVSDLFPRLADVNVETSVPFCGKF